MIFSESVIGSNAVDVFGGLWVESNGIFKEWYDCVSYEGDADLFVIYIYTWLHLWIIKSIILALIILECRKKSVIK